MKDHLARRAFWTPKLALRIVEFSEGVLWRDDDQHQSLKLGLRQVIVVICGTKIRIREFQSIPRNLACGAERSIYAILKMTRRRCRACGAGICFVNIFSTTSILKWEFKEHERPACFHKFEKLQNLAIDIWQRLKFCWTCPLWGIQVNLSPRVSVVCCWSLTRL